MRSNAKYNNMKTPLQEIYAHLKASKEKDSFGETYCVDWLLENESKMLHSEEEMIKYSYWEGVKSVHCDDFKVNDWYNKNFNQKNANK